MCRSDSGNRGKPELDPLEIGPDPCRPAGHRNVHQTERVFWRISEYRREPVLVIIPVKVLR
jgi:hypothetical protein